MLYTIGMLFIGAMLGALLTVALLFLFDVHRAADELADQETAYEEGFSAGYLKGLDEGRASTTVRRRKKAVS